MQKWEKKQLKKIVVDLKKVEDHMRELIVNIEKAMEANDEAKVITLFSDLQAMRKTQRLVLSQAETYRDMLVSKEKRSQEQEQLKRIIN
jgi:chromatin segregation and condensation protein Rec8/ScpA/Scc1 (kleisin family)